MKPQALYPLPQYTQSTVATLVIVSSRFQSVLCSAQGSLYPICMWNRLQFLGNRMFCTQKWTVEWWWHRPMCKEKGMWVEMHCMTVLLIISEAHDTNIIKQVYQQVSILCWAKFKCSGTEFRLLDCLANPCGRHDYTHHLQFTINTMTSCRYHSQP